MHQSKHTIPTRLVDRLVSDLQKSKLKIDFHYLSGEMDLTLRLGVPTPTLETNLSLNTLNSHQGTKVVDNGRGNNKDGGEGGDNKDGGGERLSLRQMLWGDDEVDDDKGARNNVNVNIRVYNHVFQQFAGIGETLNFAPYPMPLSPAPAPVTSPVNDYVLLDVPARRAHRNNVMAMANAWNADANAKRFRGCNGYCGGRIEGTRRCTNKNCNALNTPMWRKGPLGPKSLCNACGIKFRKEEERRSNRK